MRLARVLVPASVFLAVLMTRPGADAPTRITGPYVHENLAVYVLHGAPQTTEFLTLDEGLRAGLVDVSERARAKVAALTVENRAERPLFLQEGDRLKGGRQDRIIGASFVVPPRSGPVEVPSFCIEPRRWSGGAAVSGSSTAALAGNDVRWAAKAEQSQSRVWDRVASFNANASLSVLPEASLNASMDAPEMERQAAAYEASLGDLLARHDDAVGVAFALDGRVEEVNVYPSRPLLHKLYPRLLASYAMQAACRRGESRPAPHATEVARLMRDPKSVPAYAAPPRTPTYEGGANFYSSHCAFAGDDLPEEASPRGVCGSMTTNVYAAQADAYAQSSRETPHSFRLPMARSAGGSMSGRLDQNWAQNPTFAWETEAATPSPESARFEATYQGAVVHRQWLRRPR